MIVQTFYSLDLLIKIFLYSAQTKYEVILNTDSHYYWGSNFTMGDALGVFFAEQQEWQGKPFSLTINLPPLSTVYLQKKEK